MVLALERSSVRRVCEMETARGEAIAQDARKRFSGSFFRSGKIGGWSEYFDDPDLEWVDEVLAPYGMSIGEIQLRSEWSYNAADSGRQFRYE
jgi:hypothetical protein